MLSPVAVSPQPVSQHTETSPKFNQITSENLTLRIAETPEEVLAAQRLRYEVFYKEMGAHPVGDTAEKEREFEFYDDYCQHLLVIDNSINKVVGTYRALFCKTVKEKGIEFCVDKEYDFSKLYATGGKIMEISRSCVLESHRNKAVINLLWKGIATLVFGNHIDYLVGTASFFGVDIETEKQALAYLKAFHAADPSICPRVHEEYYHPLPTIDKSEIDVKRTFLSLPPLLKGYLRCGAVVGDGIFIDHQFNCLDVALIMPIDQVNDRYFNHYKRVDAQ